MIDKNEILEKIISSNEEIVLEIGCGSNKRHSETIGIDALDYPCVDIVGDVFEVLKEFPDNSVDSIFSAHFLEHIVDIEKLLDEIARVLKKDGELNIIVPHFANPYYYSDPTHKTFFGLYTMSYYSEDLILTRKVPTYQKKISFSLRTVELRFKSSPPFYVRHAIKKFFGLLVNLNSYTKELYEEMFCHFIPCYEIEYKLQKI